jgi:hypothetical protein
VAIRPEWTSASGLNIGTHKIVGRSAAGLAGPENGKGAGAGKSGNWSATIAEPPYSPQKERYMAPIEWL